MYVILDTDKRPEPVNRPGRAPTTNEKENKNMHVIIQHAINDSAKWEASVRKIMSLIEERRVPAGLKPLQYLPSTDGRNANCVWEADSMAQIKQFVDRETAGARNDYFQIKADAAIGLPTGAPLAAAAA